MPAVFVHGVNNRAGPEYDARKALIAQYCNAHLRGLALAGSTLEHATPVFPYWGGDAAKFYWENASLPSGSFDALGTSTTDTSPRPIVASLIQQLPASEITGEPLLSLARKDFVAAVEALSAVLIDPAAPGTPSDKAAFIVAAQRYALDATRPRTPASVSNDQQWEQWLEAVVTPEQGGAQGLGVFGDVSNALQAGAYRLKTVILGAGQKLVDRSGNLVSSLVMAWGRESLNVRLGRFFDDIFVYLSGRGRAGSPGEIPTIVIDAIQSARSLQPDEPLVLIGHSLGGVILYDLKYLLEAASRGTPTYTEGLRLLLEGLQLLGSTAADARNRATSNLGQIVWASPFTAWVTCPPDQTADSSTSTTYEVVAA